jgi:hypothetical protein
VIKDPDEEVAAAISDVLAAFTATGSAYQVVACFADHCPATNVMSQDIADTRAHESWVRGLVSWGSVAGSPCWCRW